MEGGGLAAERISVSSSFLVLVLVLDPESLRSEDEDEHEGRGRHRDLAQPPKHRLPCLIFGYLPAPDANG